MWWTAPPPPGSCKARWTGCAPEMAAILAGVLPVFLLLALGYGLKKSDYLPDAAWRPIEKLAYNDLLPGFLYPANWYAVHAGPVACLDDYAVVHATLIVSP